MQNVGMTALQYRPGILTPVDDAEANSCEGKHVRRNYRGVKPRGTVKGSYGAEIHHQVYYAAPMEWI